jgi:hypothetical protein
MQRPAIRARNHLDAVASDFPIGNVRPQGQLNVTGKFMTSDPACGQYPSFPSNQTDVAAIEGP